jgi:hypothetical protein
VSERQQEPRDPDRMWLVLSFFGLLILAEASFMWAENHWGFSIFPKDTFAPPSQTETQPSE